LFTLEQRSNQPIRFEGQVYSLSILDLKPGLGASTPVIHLSFPSDFREMLWVGLGVRIWLGIHLHTGMLFQDQQNSIIPIPHTCMCYLIKMKSSNATHILVSNKNIALPVALGVDLWSGLMSWLRLLYDYRLQSF